MSISGLVGQSDIIEYFKKSICTGRVDHFYIISGPDGSGKHTMADLVSNMLVCENKEDMPCGKCASCHRFNAGSHPDVNYISQNKSSIIKIEQIRAMEKDILIKPYYGGKKVYIIEEGDMLKTDSQNSLLKTLEEPPMYAVVILLTERPDRLLPTVRSRAQLIRMKSIPLNMVKDHIKQKYSLEGSKADLIARLSSGWIGKAEEICRTEDYFDIRDKSIDILNRILKGDTAHMFEYMDDLLQYKDDIQRILTFWEFYLRDIIVANETKDKDLIINSDYCDMLSNSNKYKIKKVFGSISLIYDIKKKMQNNSNFQMSVEELLLKLLEA